ncbi:hypothetical protein [Paenarthrobacter sp. YJN-5]|uniref:hypothetical protein n=1 Tax=Paenarthrobacter sp. YJN-5 TaxID=2735316 RepID=UPI00187844FB|nr:hypothetical protein [Paenarthrobacter sp. YJN-5]QOT19557.1 hypothetical protein HMI59_23310 [Paenarthrobacter sp. YJN-5]
MSDLPKTIKRWCCDAYKSCGNTTLYLATFDGPEGYPALYDYQRGNENSYTGGWPTEQSIRDWLEATRDNIQKERNV